MTPPRTTAPAAASRAATPASAPPAQGAPALPGSPFPLGPDVRDGGTNFAVEAAAESLAFALRGDFRNRWLEVLWHCLTNRLACDEVIHLCQPQPGTSHGHITGGLTISQPWKLTAAKG